MSEQNFAEAYDQLRELLYSHKESLSFPKDSSMGIIAETKPKDGKPEFFAGAEIKKNYVSFYFMPIYCYPDLLETISPELNKRKQGKSCFNFTRPEPKLFKEIAEHIKTGIKRYRLKGKI